MEEGVGSYVRALRQERRLSAERTAQRSGIRRATISDWETGRRQPRLPELEAVLQALGASGDQRREALARMQPIRALVRLRQEQQSADLVSRAGYTPNGGDLLRAMRLRKGWTLDAAGRAIGVPGNVISRWERSAMWPDAPRLHALCFALDAREEELTALLRGRLTREADNSLTPKVLRQNAERFLDALPSQEQGALYDLNCLSLIAQIWPLAEKDASFRALLGRIYVVYSDFLFGQARFAACEKMTLRAQDLVGEGGKPTGNLSFALLRAAGAAYESGARRGAKRAEEYLRWALSLPIDTVAATPALAIDRRVWMFSALARAFLRQGRREEAERAWEEALSLAEHITDGAHFQDSLHRLLGVFVEAGCCGEALRIAARIDSSLETYPMNIVRMARLTHLLGDGTAALWNKRVRALCEDERLLQGQPRYATFFQQQAASLVRELDGAL